MTPGNRDRLEEIRAALEAHMAARDPRRYRHSLGVASTAAELAGVYGVDVFEAAAAGLLHDWDKVVADDELLARASALGVRVAGSPAQAVGLLHGPVAALELPAAFPDLPRAVWRAVARHTTAAEDMSPLDMAVFTADSIEPGRRGDHAERLRALVGEVPLEELFFQTFAQGLVYVLQTERYLYPTAVDIYNRYALARGRA